MFAKIKNLALIFTALILFSSFVLAQENAGNSLDRIWGVPENPKRCVPTWQNIEDAKIMLQKQTNPKAVLILVARLGDGENRRELNRRRLFNVKSYMKAAFGVEPEKIVTAEGERTNGFGRVEFYLAGQIVGAILVNRNKDLQVDCYGDHGGFYPEKDAIERKKTKSKNKRRG